MREMRFDLDDAGFQNMLRQLSDRDVRIAATWALNDTAQEALTDIQLRMEQVFDRPTRFTRNAFMVWKATPRTLEAVVQERPDVGSRHYLKVQERGGSRPLTGLEQRLALAADGDLAAAIPTAEARLDAFGNWSTGERNQVLAALKVGRDVGYTSNASAASTARGKRRGRAEYFVPRGNLPPGVYRRAKPGDSPVRIVLFTTTAPTYTPRLRFFDEVEQVWRERLPVHLDRTLFRILTRRTPG